jgi:hypothetical protein
MFENGESDVSMTLPDLYPSDYWRTELPDRCRQSELPIFPICLFHLDYCSLGNEMADNRFRYFR